MDARHAERLTPGTRVAVFMGAAVSELTGQPPIVTTATVMEHDPEGTFTGDGVWLAVDIAQGTTLPQRYRVDELIGFLMPLAKVTDHGDGTLTATLPGVSPDSGTTTV